MQEIIRFVSMILRARNMTIGFLIVQGARKRINRLVGCMECYIEDIPATKGIN